MTRRLACALCAPLLTLVLVADAWAHGSGYVPQPMAKAASPCPGDPIRVDRAIEGEFDRSQQGSYVLVPFDVPAGTTAVRV